MDKSLPKHSYTKGKFLEIIFVLYVAEEEFVIHSHMKGEGLEVGRARVDEFRAMSSTVYMCLTSDDPILTAFYLIRRADKLSCDDPIFKVGKVNQSIF